MAEYFCLIWMYLAVSDLTIFNTREEAEGFKGVHAGYTKEEMDIPFIVVESDKTTHSRLDIISGQKYKLWLDDIREVPIGYLGAKSVNEAISIIELIEVRGGIIELLDLDHDLGDFAKFGGDAIKLLDYLCERETYYPIAIHTANPVGRANMERVINRFWP